MIIAIVITVLLGVVVAEDTCDYGGVVQDDCPIDNCCDLGYGKSTFTCIFNKPNIYKIKNFCGNQHSILTGYCDTITDGGGWLVIQRRKDGSVNFNRDWVDYEEGFGTLTGEFWYGLRAIHCLTNQGQWELRIDFMFANRTKGYLSYRNFRVGPGSANYPLTISEFTGDTDNPFASHTLNRMQFTTKDRDNDRWEKGNCATSWVGGNAGGWWYKFCSNIYPNHQYNHMYTINLYSEAYSLPFIELKIRPKDCNI